MKIDDVHKEDAKIQNEWKVMTEDQRGRLQTVGRES